MDQFRHCERRAGVEMKVCLQPLTTISTHLSVVLFWMFSGASVYDIYSSGLNVNDLESVFQAVQCPTGCSRVGGKGRKGKVGMFG
ncbi:hypothetical protein TNCT_200461 [Trichonephila clavata]|uniref:Uncharacterized protein n=1 Tax=Trichonephila clavata TaxID=2740835 RepID=A0A8X6GSY6_TRICU|nr:hypothetical protein TNCT_200461 [Trichonephila clavata]